MGSMCTFDELRWDDRMVCTNLFIRLLIVYDLLKNNRCDCFYLNLSAYAQVWLLSETKLHIKFLWIYNSLYEYGWISTSEIDSNITKIVLRENVNTLPKVSGSFSHHTHKRELWSSVTRLPGKILNALRVPSSLFTRSTASFIHSLMHSLIFIVKMKFVKPNYLSLKVTLFINSIFSGKLH